MKNKKMNTKKILALFTFIFITISLVGCSSSDPVQEDLLRYTNEDLPPNADLEEKVINSYESISGDNYIDDETMYYGLENEVIPASMKLIDNIESITPDTNEVREVHEIYISAINDQNSAFITILSALENQDYDRVSQANEKLDSARKQLRDFEAEIKELGNKHNVTVTFEE